MYFGFFTLLSISSTLLLSSLVGSIKKKESSVPIMSPLLEKKDASGFVQRFEQNPNEGLKNPEPSPSVFTPVKQAPWEKDA